MANANFYSPDGGITRYPLEDTEARSRIAGQQSLLKDTVGWTGKNLLKNIATSQTINGITITVNADKSVTVNGTATSLTNINFTEAMTSDKELIFSLGANSSSTTFKGFITATGGTGDIANTGNSGSVKFTTSKTFFCHMVVYAGATFSNVTVYPMLRKADITDPTYEPYHDSVEVMYEEEIHGVNLLPRFTLDDLKAINTSGTWNNNVYTRNGITFTVNEDTQTVSISSGTSTAYANFRFNINLKELLKRDIPYTVNGMSNSMGRLFIYDRGADRVLSENHGGDSSFVIPSNRTFTNNIELIFDVNQNVTIQATTIRPMIRLATIEDSTYRPYNPQAIQNQLNAQRVLGAKNLLPNTAISQTIRGVTFTVNADGSVTANGTATEGNASLLNWSNTLTLPPGKYIFSGCPSGGSSTTYALLIQDEPYTESIFEYGDGAVIDISETKTFHPYFGYVKNGVTVSNLTFKPMLRLASDPDDTYVPYVMTNRELTEVKDVTVTAGNKVTLNANTNVSKVGKTVSGCLRLEFTGIVTVQQVLATLSDKPMINTYTIGIESVTNKVMPIIILSNGQVLLFGNNLPTDTNNQLIIPVNFITA